MVKLFPKAGVLCGVLLLASAATAAAAPPAGLLPITGTFLDVAYDERMTYTNNVSASLTCDQWVDKVVSLHSLGVDTIIFQAVHDARWGSYYPSSLPFMKLWGGACPDVVDTILNATAANNMHTFLSCEYVHTEFDPVENSTIMDGRIQIMQELTAKYALRYTSFMGWYFSAEAYLEPYFPPEFFPYIEALSDSAKQLTPNALIFISPYGTRYAVNDETFVNQLKSLPVDIVAYQDEVGCVRDEFPVMRSASAFETLAAAHRAANRSILWANCESFTWERMPNNVTSPLIPAEFTRMMAQWLAVAKAGVAKVISFTMQGMFEAATAQHPWGGPNATYNAAQYMALFGGSSKQLLTTLQAINGSVAHEGIGAAVGTSCMPALGMDVADLSDGLCGPQTYESPLWNAYFAEPALPLIVTMQQTSAWSVRSAAVHVLRVPPIWFKDGMWYNPIARNFTSDMPSQVEFYVSSGASLSSPAHKCETADCVAASGVLIGTATAAVLSQTTYDFLTELFAVENATAVSGNTVTAVIRVSQPQFVVVDEVLVNF